MQVFGNQAVTLYLQTLAQAMLYCYRTQNRNKGQAMKLSKIILATVASVGLLSSAQATQITGMLNIGGTATFNTNSLLTASSATFNNAHVEDLNTGDFAGIAINTPVVMTS